MRRSFSLSAQNENARVGQLSTRHGKIKTPFFMPVATKGSVKYVDIAELERLGIECVISNSLLFSLRPGLDVIEASGGIHAFSGWKHGIFTDSGGFQILRDKFFLRIDDDGVHFRNPFEGTTLKLSPEKSMEIQSRLQSDVAMCLDDVPAFGSNLIRVAESLRRTTEWARRCLESHSDSKQGLFGICQGGIDARTRTESARAIGQMDFDGFAVGGLAIGEPLSFVASMARIANKELPVEKPRYAMGVGSPAELVACVAEGIDCFDSAFPTQVGRHGWAETPKGYLNLQNRCFQKDFAPLDADCGCPVCNVHSRAFLHHLARNNEQSAGRFLSEHNLAFTQKLMENMRIAIRENDWKTIHRDYAAILKPRGQIPAESEKSAGN